MCWKRLHNFAREQLQKVNPIIVRSLIRLRSGDLALRASARPTIVFSPHQDDEVLGCGGMIINKRRLGAKIYIVFMTDGRASHKSRFITPAELAELRTIEARECAKTMGVPEENLIFLEFEDGCLSRYEAEAQKHVAKILREFLPAEVFVPFRREAPADHRATYNIVRNALEQIDGKGLPAIELYEYFVWTIRLWFWRIQELYELDDWRRIDVRQIRHLKKSALERYRSQITALYPDPKWATLPQDLLAWSLQPYEYYLKNL
jgi:LmbE family N-acetylglucosaminyl deacetylase